MTSPKQSPAAKKNLKKAAKSAKEKQTLKHLPAKTKSALGKQAVKVKKERAKKDY
ncbi:hypothetical protein MYP_3192 [Sporocytophaga myxococcoides]|uniref:Uncharacterized protein n=1 Tax=Sporocytophaga myxococcoides TaxID=153721 RepID=A0A098LIG5_9BACT|nr:hypothetical protein [Sporocytophaga myxococcoides]GAL85963.1 hypothetical protein MYP_3192 [Sporocytophaga myxococcoides]